MKLTNQIRDDIRSQLMKKAFSKKQELIAEAEFNVSQSLYDEYIKEYQKYINKLPENWLTKRDYIYIRDINGYLLSVQLRGNIKTTRDLPSFQLKKEDRTQELLTKFLKQKEEFIKEKQTMDLEIKSVLNSVNTTQQLLKTWPEVEEFIPRDAERPITALALPIKNLNKSIGLP